MTTCSSSLLMKGFMTVEGGVVVLGGYVLFVGQETVILLLEHVMVGFTVEVGGAFNAEIET